MIDTIDANKVVSGRITIYKIKNGRKYLILARKNTILANAKFILAKQLMQDRSADLTQIRLFNGGALQANGIISTRVYLDPNEVQFATTFTEDSFSGAITQMYLSPADPVAMGDFSQVTGLALNKANNEQLQITWNIKYV